MLVTTESCHKLQAEKNFVVKKVVGNELPNLSQSAHKESVQKAIHGVFYRSAAIFYRSAGSNCIKCIIFSKKLRKRKGQLNCIEKGDAPASQL